MKKKSVFGAAFTVTFMMLFFKVIGFIKQAVIAYYFGTTFETDAYFVAYGFINGITEIIVRSICFSIISIYSSILFTKGKEYANKLISGILEILTPIFGGITVLLCLFAPVIAHLLAPTSDYSMISRIVLYIYSLSPIMILCMIELIFGSVLDSNKDFYISRLQSFIYSICIIVVCVLLSSALGVKSLIIGQYLSSIIFTIILIFRIKKYWKFSFTKIKEIPEIKKILITAIPLFIGSGVLQLNQIIDKSIATSLENGAASALTYAQTLEQFVTNIMIVNIGNVLFAHFAEFVAKKKYNELCSTLSKAINIIVSLLIPISIITIFYSKDIVSFVYFRGNFSEKSVILSSSVLVGYAFGFAFIGIRDLMTKSIYSFNNTIYPMISSIISIIINIIFSIYLSKKIGILGISIATCISSFIGMVINIVFFKKIIKDYSLKENFKTILKIIPGSVVLIIIILTFNCILKNRYLFIIISFFGLLLYFIILVIMNVEEFVKIKKFLFRKVGLLNGKH